MNRMLFTPLMVEAIMNDLKTNTRRLLTPTPDVRVTKIERHNSKQFLGKVPISPAQKANLGGVSSSIICGDFEPKYKVGEIVGVAESYYAFGYWEYGPLEKKKGKNGWNFMDRTHNLRHEYRYTENPPLSFGVGKPKIKNPVIGETSNPQWYKRSPLFMPTDAVRLKVQITDIKVERLLDISNEDAINEGIFPPVEDCFYDYRLRSYVAANAPNSYFSLWDSINPDNPHTNNPWVWVYHFQKI